MALSELACRKAQPCAKKRTLADAFGLALFIPAQGRKAWHFRFRWGGVPQVMSFGTYPEVSLQLARQMRDDARALLAQGLNPRMERSRNRQAAALATEHTFMAVYEKWREHRKLTLEEGRQTSMSQIARVFEKDVFPVLRSLTVHEIVRAHLLDIIGRVEARGALSVAEKLRTWFTQLFTYATVVVPGMKENPSDALHVVALPLPPVEHNPFLRMPELPQFLQALRKHRGRLGTQLATRLLLLTGVRTGELRRATPDQFDLDKGLWYIPVEHLKQRKALTTKKRRRPTDVPPYIVPLSVQAQEIVRHLLAAFKPAQIYLFTGYSLRKPISEGTVNVAIKRLGYADRLTGHGLRGTLSTALHELGYLKKWVDAQLSHTDPDEVSRAYNHAKFVEQRRVMMQDWADRLDLLEQGMVEVACMPLTVTLQGLPTMAGQSPEDVPPLNPSAPQLVVAPPADGAAVVPPSVYRLPSVETPEYAKPALSAEQRGRLDLLKMFESPHNLRVADYAKLVGLSRRAISYQITGGKLLALDLGNRGLRIPDWQLHPLKHSLVQIILDRAPPGTNAWQIYHALMQCQSALKDRAPIEAVTPGNLERVVALVRDVLAEDHGEQSAAVPTEVSPDDAGMTRFR